MINISTFLTLFASSAGAFFLLWLIQLRTQDASWVDVLWATSIGLIALYIYTCYSVHTLRHTLILLCSLLWSGRLAFHIARRLLMLKHEDSRYQTMRAHFGARAHFKFLLFFEIQALFVMIFATPIMIALLSRPATFGLNDFVGLIIFFTAWLGETIADKQLLTHRATQGANVTCQRGLWRYSRHPNYFFEWMHWFAYACFSWHSPLFWVTALVPFVMLVFLLKLTGIPHAERESLKKKPDYAQYQRTTSPFIPWFKKSH